MFRFTEDWHGKWRFYSSEERFSRKEMKRIYEKEIDHKSYRHFEDWMWEMRRCDLIKQNFPSEKELQQYAKDSCRSIVIHSYNENGGSIDIRREATEEESKILYKIIYGALLGVRSNLDENTKISAMELQACIDSAEFIAMQFLPNCNTYDSVYRVVNEYYED